MSRRPWTQADDARLRAAYADISTQDLAKELGRPAYAIYNRAYALGLRKSEAYLYSPAACRLRRGDNIGAAYRFRPGQVPPNKGLRRPGYGPGRMKETQFKPGERRGIAAKNWCPVGTIRTDSEGYQRIKVREARPGEPYGFGNPAVWPLRHRVIWEEAHGPIPAGHAVCFRDRDRSNCVLANLELIPRRALMARNTVHNLPAPLPQLIQLTGALRRQIRRRTRAQEQDR